MAAVLAAASPLADVLWRKATDNQNFDTPERRAALRKALDDLASAIADGNVQGYYRQHFADRLAAAFGARREAQSAASPFRPRGPVVPPGSNRPVPPPTSSRREQVLLAAIINHAELLNGHEDEISQISLLLPELDRLRGAILDVHAQLPGLDSDALRRHLVEAGQGELVAWLLRSEVTRLYRFVQSDTPLAEVEADWKQALALQRKAVDSAQLREEGAAFGQDMTEAKEGRFLALKRQLASGEGVEADPSPVSRG
jgi:DNA primase